MTPDELYTRIMRTIQLRKDGLLTDQDENDSIALLILEFVDDLVKDGQTA